MLAISVIIPTYNRAYCLARAIDSVLNQTYQAKTIIVIDDGSTDNTALLMQSNYPQIEYFRQDNAGVSAARNSGIRRVKSDWIALLDSDDEWLPNKLEKQVALQSKHPEFKLCHTEEIWIRNGKRVNQMNKHHKTGGWIFHKCLARCVISPSSVLLHVSLFENVGFFREDFPACEDYDLWLRICAIFPVLFLEEPNIVKYGGHEDQLSRKHWGMDRFRIRSLVDLLNNKVLSHEQEELAHVVLKKKINVFLGGARKRNKLKDVAYYESLLCQMGLQ